MFVRCPPFQHQDDSRTHMNQLSPDCFSLKYSTARVFFLPFFCCCCWIILGEIFSRSRVPPEFIEWVFHQTARAKLLFEKKQQPKGTRRNQPSSQESISLSFGTSIHPFIVIDRKDFFIMSIASVGTGGDSNKMVCDSKFLIWMWRCFYLSICVRWSHESSLILFLFFSCHFVVSCECITLQWMIMVYTVKWRYETLLHIFPLFLLLVTQWLIQRHCPIFSFMWWIFFQSWLFTYLPLLISLPPDSSPPPSFVLLLITERCLVSSSSSFGS